MSKRIIITTDDQERMHSRFMELMSHVKPIPGDIDCITILKKVKPASITASQSRTRETNTRSRIDRKGTTQRRMPFINLKVTLNELNNEHVQRQRNSL